SAPPSPRFGDGVGAGAGEDGYGEHSRADEPEREQPVGSISGEGTQRFGRLLGSGDGPQAVGVKGDGGDEDDEEHDEVREEHPGDDVRAGPAQLLVGGAPAGPDTAPAPPALLLHFLGRLPAEEVGRDGGSQDSNE